MGRDQILQINVDRRFAPNVDDSGADSLKSADVSTETVEYVHFRNVERIFVFHFWFFFLSILFFAFLFSFQSADVSTEQNNKYLLSHSTSLQYNIITKLNVLISFQYFHQQTH